MLDEDRIRTVIGEICDEPTEPAQVLRRALVDLATNPGAPLSRDAIFAALIMETDDPEGFERYRAELKRKRFRIGQLDRFMRERRRGDHRTHIERSKPLNVSYSLPVVIECSNRRPGEGETESFTERAAELINSPDPMRQVEEAIRALGYAGSPDPAKIAYLAVTSRLLDRPLSVQFEAQSASGKNFTVETALKLFPPEAFYSFSASSQRALIYAQESFAHRTIIMGEIDSIPEDGPASSALRSLLTDSVLSYDVVEKDATGRHVTRRISKSGPTGLLTTGLRSTDEQMSTRLLRCSIPDDEQQTREVLRAQAAQAAGLAPRLSDAELNTFHAFQRWLASGETHVVVPFAMTLQDLIPARAVRMRRDFPQLLTVVRTLALLRRNRRKLSGNGIEAELKDYADARALLAPLFDCIVTEGITPVIRATIEAIGPNEEISETDLAQRLNIAKSTASDRLKKAIRGGWLINRETRPGYPARISRGAALPKEQATLPTMEQVQERFARSKPCSNPETPAPEGVVCAPFECSTESGDDEGSLC